MIAIRYQSRCTHGGRACPRVIQAVPMASAERRHRPLWPTVVVVGIFLAIAVLNGLVPAIVSALP